MHASFTVLQDDYNTDEGEKTIPERIYSANIKALGR